MAFAENQLKLLESKLPEKHVKTRVQRGLTLSYIEGWHAIAEANRIFGFDGWDREMIETECVWQDARDDEAVRLYGPSPHQGPGRQHDHPARRQRGRARERVDPRRGA